jgi:hypothetical protein
LCLVISLLQLEAIPDPSSCNKLPVILPDVINFRSHLLVITSLLFSYHSVL